MCPAGGGPAPGSPPQALRDKPFPFSRARQTPRQNGVISHSCQPDSRRRQRGSRSRPRRPQRREGRRGVRVPAAGRGRVMGVRGRACGARPPRRPPPPLTWAPGAGVSARSRDAGPTPTALPRPGGQSPRPGPSRKPGGPGTPGGRRYCSHGPGLPARRSAPRTCRSPAPYLRPRTRPAAPTPGWPPPWPARSRTGPAT